MLWFSVPFALAGMVQIFALAEDSLPECSENTPHTGINVPFMAVEMYKILRFPYDDIVVKSPPGFLPAEKAW